MNRTQIFAVVKEVLEDVLGVCGDAIKENSSPDTLPEWDSLKHMRIVTALEERFNFLFEPDELIELLNVDLILDVIEGKLKS